MLIAMRRGAAGWVAKILFGLLILSFAAWGIGDYLTPEADPVIATVGDVEIRRTTLDRAERAQAERIQQMLGANFNMSQLPENAARSAALDQLVAQAAFDMEARTLGLTVGDQAIGDTIRANPQFRNGDNFDADAFRRALFGAGMSEDAYVASLRGDLARSLLAGAIAAQIPPPLPLAEAMFVNERQKRSIAYVSMPTEGVETPDPTDSEIRAYVEANALAFAEPERRDIRAILLTNAAIAAAITVSDAEVANMYQDTQAVYATPERRSFIQALFSEEEEARAFAVAPPSNAAEFENLAETSGAVVTELTELTRTQVFPAAVAEAAFKMTEGAIGDPVQTALGWHVLLSTNVAPEAVRPLEDVADAIRQEIKTERSLNGLTDFANNVEDALAGGKTIDAAASAAGLPVTRLAAIDRTGADRNGDVDPLMPQDPRFLSELFERPTGEQSGLIELANGEYVAVIVDAVHATGPKPFEDVREAAEAGWLQEKQAELATARMIPLKDAKSLEAFKAAAGELDLEVTETGLMTREEIASTSALSPTLVTNLFAMPKSDSLEANMPKALIVAFVADVQRPAFDQNGTDEKAFIAELTSRYAADRLQRLTEVVQTAHPSDLASNALLRYEPPVPATN